MAHGLQSDRQRHLQLRPRLGVLLRRRPARSGSTTSATCNSTNNGANAQGAAAHRPGISFVEGKLLLSVGRTSTSVADAVDSHVGQQHHPSRPSPGPNDLQLTPLQAAGPDGVGPGRFADATNLETDYVSAPQATYSNDHHPTMRVLIGGARISPPRTPVYFSGHAVPEGGRPLPGVPDRDAPPGRGPLRRFQWAASSPPPNHLRARRRGATGSRAKHVHHRRLRGQRRHRHGDRGRRPPCAPVTVTSSAVGRAPRQENDGQHALTARPGGEQRGGVRIAAGDHRLRGRHGTGPPSAVNDTDPGFQYSGFSYSNNRGYGDLPG